ncbi:MAG: YiiX/YebB-like N1pC/P60 family cysteine hydrolase [Verrucomicrobiota bacterium]|nr:YiiX/YebB-like N1pC/P60 family cysteine hydrolase [Verrucomicrobiota bacterium]
MSNKDIAQQLRSHYRLIQWSAFLFMGLLLLAGFALGRFWSIQGQLTFCAFGVATGAAFARMCHPMNRELTLLGWTSLGFLAASQVFYQMLVWSEAWRVDSSVLGWRLWWGAIVVTVCLGLLQVLWRAGARWEWNSGRTTLCFTTLLGLLLAGLAFRPNLMASTPAWWEMLALLSALGTVVGSGVIITRWIRKRPKNPRPLPRGMKTALWATAQLVLVAGAFYVGRISVPPPSPFDSMPSALAEMTKAEVKQQINVDHRVLREITHSLDALREETAQWHVNIHQVMGEEKRAIYEPHETDALRNLFHRYLKYRGRLTQMVALYLGYREIRDERLRARAYLLGCCAGATMLEAGRLFVVEFVDDPLAREKLNEADPGRLEEEMFENVYHGVTSQEHMNMYAMYSRRFTEKRAEWRTEKIFAPEDFDWLAARIEASTKNIRAAGLSPVGAWFSRIKRRLLRDANEPIYKAQEIVSSIVGDTRMVSRPAFVSDAHIGAAVKTLQPGDILLVRRNWYLSNAFLPGFWPHAALYVGTPKQLELLGIDKSNAGPAWEKYMVPEDGHQRVVLEAVSEGVGFYAAEHSMKADYALAMRPVLTQEQKKTAILKAFGYAGRAYDFNFDFFTDDKIVCSELVHRAYGGTTDPMLKFDFEKMLGKEMVTPLGIGRKCALEHGQPDGQLKFVLFLDTTSGATGAHFVTPQTLRQACVESMDRPKAFNE